MYSLDNIEVEIGEGAEAALAAVAVGVVQRGAGPREEARGRGLLGPAEGGAVERPPQLHHPRHRAARELQRQAQDVVLLHTRNLHTGEVRERNRQRESATNKISTASNPHHTQEKKSVRWTFPALVHAKK